MRYDEDARKSFRDTYMSNMIKRQNETQNEKLDGLKEYTVNHYTNFFDSLEEEIKQKE